MAKRKISVKSPTPKSAIDGLLGKGTSEVKESEAQEGESPNDNTVKPSEIEEDSSSTEDAGGVKAAEEVKVTVPLSSEGTSDIKPDEKESTEGNSQSSTQIITDVGSEKKKESEQSKGETKEVEKKTRKPSVKNLSKARSLTIEDLKAENEGVLSGVSKSIPTDANIHLTLQTVGRVLKIPLQKITNNLLLRAIEDYGGDLEKLKEEHGSSKNVVIRKLI